MSYKSNTRDDTGTRGKTGGRQAVSFRSGDGIDVTYVDVPFVEEGALPYADLMGVAPDEYEQTLEAWFEAQFLKTPMGKGRAAFGNPDLGTFRVSQRSAAKARRESDRRETCEVCGKQLVPARSDARFCSAACKQKHWRATRKAVPA